MLPTWQWIPHLTDKANNLLAEQWELINLITDSPDDDGLWELLVAGEASIADMQAQNRIRR